MPIALDEYPVHQAPISMARVATSDRNFYDRCYFSLHDRNGKLFLTSGLGIYPNLGVIDAFVVVRIGDRQIAFHASDALTDDRMRQQVGPYRIEVIEPLHKLRLVCDAAAYGFSLDMVFESLFPAIDEVRQTSVDRHGRVVKDVQRFAQPGRWSGRLAVEGETFDVSPANFLGFRDRSWGVRPVGLPEPATGHPATHDPAFGTLWTYVPLQFEDYTILLVAGEDGSGHRHFNHATRVWKAETGRPTDELGWPFFKVRYRSGSREVVGVSIQLTPPDGKPLQIELERTGNPVIMQCGMGYPGDKEWAQGVWRGPNFVEKVVYDMTDPAIQARLMFGSAEYPVRAIHDGDIGYGMFEHACIGRHIPSGFSDFTSVAL